MATNSETSSMSTQFAQIFSRVKQLTVREQLTLAKLLLESILEARPELESEWPAGFFEATAGAWAGEPLAREDQGDYETRSEL